MDILVAADRDYLAQLPVMLQSLFTSNAGEPIHLHAIVGDQGVGESVEALCARHGAVLSVYGPPNAAQYMPHKRAIHGAPPTSAYWRIFAAELLPRELAKVLYLDIDLVVRKPLSGLWSTELGGAPLAASAHHTAHLNEEFTAPFGGRYFNSGVMLINLEHWRNEDVAGKSVAFARKHPERVLFFDQCILNAVCPDWLFVDIAWNCTSLSARAAPRFELSRRAYHAIQADPAIFHFVGPNKPWRRPEAEAQGIEREYWIHLRALEAEMQVLGAA